MKIKVYEVEPGKGLNRCMEKDLDEVFSWIQEAEVGEEITIKIMYMEEAEYDSLPEYTGP